jgi:hypothetical protein
MKRKILLMLTVLAFVSAVQAPSLSVTPSEVKMMDVERGETRSFDIYINPRDIEGAVRVKPLVEGPFGKSLYSNDEVNPNQISEEGMKDWVSLGRENVVATQDGSQTYTLEDGTTIDATNTIPVEVSIPEDAEPGYHAAKIGFTTSQVEGDSGFSTTNWILPYISILVKVPGNADRSVEIEDARMLRIGQNRAQIITMLENTGTVTTEVTGGNISILDSQDRKVGEIDLHSARLQPGEFQEVSMTWESENLEPGTYRVDGTGSFATGRFYIGGQDSITSAIQERVQVNEPDTETGGSSSNIPIWLVMMILILLGIIMYSFDIDPLWIALIVGVLAITAFVLMTDLPLYLIGITLILGFVMIYYGVI